MAISRRSLFKGVAAAGGTVAASTLPAHAARERRKAPEDALGMLYDTTLCIGCKACVRSCKEANDMPADRRTPGMENYDAPANLNDYTKNIIKLYKEGDRRSYVKQQCMHCVDPACVGACMIGALSKGEYGVVTWDADRCIGCRYCQMACPFGVPQFEWTDTNPYIVKCEFCKDRPDDKKYVPACCEVCPREAVIAGKYTDLLAEAKRRLEESPDRYYPKIYGEKDLGGTQVLYLSHVPFEKLGFKFSDDEPVPELQQTIQHGVYQGFIAPAALYFILGGVLWRNHRQKAKDHQKEGSE
ncbi:MAG: hydrogenase 2 operon protein HybA [Acidimicrobiia bacterium]|nr:hydrogenase 2 operon protein HybA [Acidimicrobiia bacterium]